MCALSNCVFVHFLTCICCLVTFVSRFQLFFSPMQAASCLQPKWTCTSPLQTSPRKKTSPLHKNLVLISLKILDYFETLNYFETIWLFRRESCLGGEGFVSRSDIKRHHCWHHPSHHHHHHAEHHRHQWWFTIIIIFQSFFTDFNITFTIAHNIINITSATSSPSVSLPKSQT